ncbi:MAG: hypothetical protein IPP87_12435 [Ideonella sp.]|jgi:hypothetical protein|nr:hypothetical protein [Ideonella sp.]MBL0149469.1 hypothetical protein [Ideonella sp.]
MLDGLRSQRLLALFAAGWLLLNLPLIALWDQPVRVGGVPLFPLALFVGWGALIAVAAWVAEGRVAEEDLASDDADGAD